MGQSVPLAEILKAILKPNKKAGYDLNKIEIDKEIRSLHNSAALANGAKLSKQEMELLAQ